MLPAIQIQQLSKSYKNLQALDEVSFSVEQGEFFGLLGPNGAGKTTLISILAGLTRATSGTVKIHGHEVVADYQQARRMLGVVPQELVFDPFFTVRETLRLQSGYYGLRKNDDWIDEILAHLDLTHKADSNMRALSGGMKRRVLVAQALVHKPPVIVLDEPTAGVDVELRQTLWKFIAQLNRQGHTIVLTTHYLEEAEQLCTRLAMLKGGRLVALEKTAALLKRFAGLSVRLTYQGSLPASVLAKQIEQATTPTNNRIRLRMASYNELEPILCACREAGVQLDDVQVERADLEDVFVQLMQSNGQNKAEVST